MSVTPLRQPGLAPVADRQTAPQSGGLGLGGSLRSGQISGHALLSALRRGAKGDAAVSHAIAEGAQHDSALRTDLAARHRMGVLSRTHGPPDPALIDRFGAASCLAEGVMPWRQLGGMTVVAATSPEAFARNRARLSSVFGALAPALCPHADLHATILRLRGAELCHAAETSVAEDLSCRNYDAGLMAQRLAVAAVVVLPVLLLRPALVLAVFTLCGLLAMLGFTALRLAAWAALRRPSPPLPEVTIARLPVVSVLVALYGESDIAPRLIKRLKKIDYPHDLLDVVLAVEQDDVATRQALSRSELPLWMRVVPVPRGSVRTKPRALNYALDHCRGSFVGIYDAEDAPEADQIRKIVSHFHARGSDVVCLQGVLDYYNPRQNWLSRCFTIEYAAWFRLLLPGIARLGLVVPLGGTTLFFRRAALEELGRWDAQNVTEDCDLGLRIARRGWRTEIVPTTTYEEANCHSRAWVKQRSRWIKGFMMTWLTHMRNPRRLWQDLGPKRFLGVQLLLVGSVGHALFAPLLWSFWMGVFGLPHPLVALMPPLAFNLLLFVFVVSGVLGMAFGLAGLLLSGHKISLLWLPTMAFYNPLATLAAWKAAYEMVVRPFWWDKTRHGLTRHGP